jgi:hypothetical protein
MPPKGQPHGSHHPEQNPEPEVAVVNLLTVLRPTSRARTQSRPVLSFPRNAVGLLEPDAPDNFLLW